MFDENSPFVLIFSNVASSTSTPISSKPGKNGFSITVIVLLLV